VIKPLAYLHLLLLAVYLTVLLLLPGRAHAAAAFVQSTDNVTNGGTSVAVSYTATPTANNLLVVVCGARDSATLATPTGFTSAINQSGTPSQAIFYKISAGNEGSITCSSGATNTRLGISIYEYSGNVTSSPLDGTPGSSTGTSNAVASGSTTTTTANSIVFAGITTQASTAFSAWSNTFTEREDFVNGGAAGSRTTYGGADRFVTATGTYTTTATAGASGAWIGQVVAFKVIPPLLSVDIVDASGASVTSPSVTMGATSYKFDCQPSAGTFGVSAQRMRISNSTTTATWTVSIAANTR
jgi:hypothetical protein